MLARTTPSGSESPSAWSAPPDPREEQLEKCEFATSSLAPVTRKAAPEDMLWRSPNREDSTVARAPEKRDSAGQFEMAVPRTAERNRDSCAPRSATNMQLMKVEWSKSTSAAPTVTLVPRSEELKILSGEPWRKRWSVPPNRPSPTRWTEWSSTPVQPSESRQEKEDVALAEMVPGPNTRR